ncbi:MAG: radical SAM protein, partial [Candidatus Wallbacteria bacterium]|nr:radical SAM protein [Candidatus Wallbacteria bacterium]
MLRDLGTIVRFLLDRRNRELLRTVHREFSKDRDYSFRSMVRALWRVAKDERIVPFFGSFLISSFLPPVPSRAFMQLFRSVPGKASLFREHAEAMRTAPISMYVALTERCAYNCGHCSSAGRTVGPELDTAAVVKLIHELQDMGVAIIGLTGGEPMLRPDLSRIISAIDDRSVSMLFTSGQGLDRERAGQLRKAGLQMAGVSIDHYDSLECDKRRGKSCAFSAACRAVAALRSSGIYTMVQTVVTKDLLASQCVWHMIDLAQSLGAHEIRLLETEPSGKLLCLPQTELLTCEERSRLIAVQRKANWSDRKIKVTVFAHTESPQVF